MIEKEFIDMEAVVRLDNGYSKKYAEAVDLSVMIIWTEFRITAAVMMK